MTRTYDTLCFENYDCFGFDIDHTLAKYKLSVLFQDCYNAMTNYLVRRKGYDKEAFRFDKDFCTRGLILDLELGNFMKVAHNGTVLRASHGTRRMTREQLQTEFGENITWPHHSELIKSVNNLGNRYRIFENFFDMPIAVVCAHIIDWLDMKDDDKNGRNYSFWPDVVEAIEFVYNPKQYKADDGDFFPKWKQDTGRYVEKCSENLIDWLKRLRTGNKKLFVISSSMDDFAIASLQFILGDDWRTYFDIFITLAKKPGFFTSNRSFMKSDESGKMSPIDELCKGEVYLNGNYNVLTEHLVKFTGKDNPKVLFFGDSLRSDVCPAKQFASWDTVLVLDEIDACAAETDFTSLSQNSNETPTKRRKYSIQNHTESLYLCSSYWGSLFIDHQEEDLCKKGAESNQITEGSLTIWSHIICKYADIAVPNLDCLTEYPMDYKYQRFDKDPFSVSGFHPNYPKKLKHLSKCCRENIKEHV